VECVQREQRAGENLVYRTTVNELDPDFLDAYVKEMEKEKIYPNPEISFPIGSLIKTANIIAKSPRLTAGSFLICWHDSSGTSPVNEVKGSKLYDHANAKVPWKHQFRPVLRRDKKGAVLAADKPLADKWNSLMKERGLTVSPADYSVDVELVSLDDFAALIEVNFPGNTFLVKVKDTAGKSNPALEAKVTGKTITADLAKVNSWKIFLRPFVGNDRPLRIGCKFSLWREGVPRTMEWWHFQYNNAIAPDGKNKVWSELMEEIGWTKEGLQKVGYSEKQLQADAH
jgi:hypothetical protein